MKNFLLIPIISLLLLSSGCAVQKEFIQTELYFGLSIPGGKLIPDSAWNQFVQNEVVKIFPDGFTELDTKGKWLDTETKELTSEPSRLITVVYKPGKFFSGRIDSLRNKYKNLFFQQSVLRVDKKAGISF